MDSKLIAADLETAAVRRRIPLMGIPLDNLTLAEAVRAIVEALESDRPRRVCFVNADCVNLSRRHADYRKILQTADFAFADGIGMRLAGIVLGRRVRANVNGTDLFPAPGPERPSAWPSGWRTGTLASRWRAAATAISRPARSRTSSSKFAVRNPTSCSWPWARRDRMSGSPGILPS
jgi:hypothetical protein